MDNQRNLILAVVLTGLLLFGWQAGVDYFYPQTNKPAVTASASPSASPAQPGAPTNPADSAAVARDLKTALDPAARVPIAAPGLTGSIALTGALIDDLSTMRHRAALARNSGPARVFSPPGTPAQQFARFGWGGQGVAVPDERTVWTAPAGAKLTPQSPVTLTWTNPTGQTFALTYAIDADYMITAAQTVTNGGAAPITVQPYAFINRTDRPDTQGGLTSVDTFNVHAGPFGAFDAAVDFGPDYSDLAEAGTIANAGKTDWIGFTDIYWMATLISDKAEASSRFRALGGGLFRADLIYANAALAPGQTLTRTTRLFAGAKESDILDRYEAAGVANFGLAIDWGWFRWFEKPLYWLLTKLFSLVGNFGVAIMLLTLIVRGIMFPLAQRQFASMAAMKAIQPKMKALQERYKDDKPKQQQEIMALYKAEGVNPLAGCLPIFLQIPVFFALYKVLIVAVDMRHQPFALWIKDLSVPDPWHFLNLFGYLDFSVPAILAIGPLALLLGVTMWLQFKLNPAQMDPMQQQIFAIMPWLMMFVMASFPAGLLLYWITSNVLTIIQQWFLYSKHPQLRAQAGKEAEDAKRAKARPS